MLCLCPELRAQQKTSAAAPVFSDTVGSAGNEAALEDAVVLASLLDEPQQEVKPEAPQSASAASNDAGPLGMVPSRKGFNATLTTASQHDSAAGWQSILSPNVAYRFNRFLSVNAGLPVYAYLTADKQTGVAKSGKILTPVYTLEVENFLLGDTTITGEFELHPKWLDYTFDATLGTPTGDDADGLGAGQVTYNFNNHFEHPFMDWFTPDIELGIGDSPNLDDARLKKSFTTVGVGAHFQAGATFSFWKNISFSTEAYEDLPLGTQTVTSLTTNGKKGKNLRVTETSTQKSIGEDNGFLNTLDIPLGGHVTLSGIYNRSLRNKDDTAGFSLTFSLKAPKQDDNAK